MLTAGQLGSNLNAATDNNTDNRFGKMVNNFTSAHNALQTTIEQQVQSIEQLTAQMNNLQIKLDMQQQINIAKTNVHPPMTMPNQQQQPYQALQQQHEYGGRGQGWSNNQHQGGG